MSEQSFHYGAGKLADNMPPRTPEQIADYIHEEFTPYASMTLEEGKKHIAELIHRYAKHCIKVYFDHGLVVETKGVVGENPMIG